MTVVPEIKTGVPRVVQWGVRPTFPVFFWDFDYTDFETILDFATYVFYESFRQFDIYESSKGRYHLVAEVRSWDEAQALLDQMRGAFPNEHYITSCRRVRLRISARCLADGSGWVLSNEIVAPEPKLVWCGCKVNGNKYHMEKRKGIVEKYTSPYRI